MTPVRKSRLKTWAIGAACLVVSSAMWSALLAWNWAAWTALDVAWWIAVAAMWRRAWRVTPTGGERDGDR